MLQCLTMEGQGIGRGQQPERRRRGRHSKRFFPRCIAREDIRCDVDENLWPNRQERQEV